MEIVVRVSWLALWQQYVHVQRVISVSNKD